ncbi:TPA: hypothetical protein LA460_000146 [Clostridium botulinum]|nr:hypothetical protein [Clostridium botulinum]HBJ1652751.1 hypothetical protein [Clostridium botulinum]
MLYGLLFAWILTWFNFDTMLIQTVKDLFDVTMSVSNYYIVFAMIGFIGSCFKN